MKRLLVLTAAVALSACASLNQSIEEATYKAYPTLSPAKRAECREVGEAVYWEERKRWPSYQDSGRARVPAADAFEKCMES